MRFYIASKIENGEAVTRLATWLKAVGHVQTYDWAVHGPVFKPDKAANQNILAMREVATAEMIGVSSADVLIALLPGGRGTHVEIGAAIALAKLVILCGDFQKEMTGRGEYPWPCAFYYHPLVVRISNEDEDQMMRAVLTWIEATL